MFPRSLLTSTAGAKVVSGDGLGRIVAEEQADSASYERDRDRIRDAVDHIGRTILYLLAIAIGPALLLIVGTWLVFGRERSSGYDREYEQEPPSDLAPALVPILLRQGGEAGSNEFTATLFDLIRRGRFKAIPVTTSRSLWGGLRHEDVADLELADGHRRRDVTAFEKPVERSCSRSSEKAPNGCRGSATGSRRIAPRTRSGSRRSRNASPRPSGPSGGSSTRGAAVLGIGAAVFGLAGAVLLVVGIHGFRAVAPRWGDIVLIAVGACLVAERSAGRRGSGRAPALAPQACKGRARGAALGGVSPVPDRLSAARGRPAGDARAVGAVPRLRNRVRDRRTCPAGCQPPDAAGAPRRELDLLDQPVWP